MYNIWRQMHCCMSQVRETLDFAARCQGAGTKPQELRRLQELEAAAGYVPDAEIDAFMKVGLMTLNLTQNSDHLSDAESTHYEGGAPIPLHLMKNALLMHSQAVSVPWGELEAAAGQLSDAQIYVFMKVFDRRGMRKFGCWTCLNRRTKMRAWVGYLPDAEIDAFITVGRPIGFLCDSLPSCTSFMSYVHPATPQWNLFDSNKSLDSTLAHMLMMAGGGGGRFSMAMLSHMSGDRQPTLNI